MNRTAHQQPRDPWYTRAAIILHARTPRGRYARTALAACVVAVALVLAAVAPVALGALLLVGVALDIHRHLGRRPSSREQVGS